MPWTKGQKMYYGEPRNCEWCKQVIEKPYRPTQKFCADKPCKLRAHTARWREKQK